MSQVEYGPLADYYELCNESSVDYDGQARLLQDTWQRYANGPRPLVLDLACGPGLLSRRLLEAELSVVGIDLSLRLLRQAARKPGQRVVLGDMRRLPFLASFDLVACLLHTMNYMAADEDLRAAFAAIEAALRPGGLAVIDFLAYEPRSQWNASWTEAVTGEGVEITCRHHQTADWRSMVATDRHTYLVRRGDSVQQFSGVDRLRITSAEEMEAAASEAGLEPLAVTRKYELDKALGWDGGVLIARRPR